MSETPINDNDVTPDEVEERGTPEEAPQESPASETSPVEAGENPDDPLYKLRQSLLDEDSKVEEPAKPTGFLQRVAGGLKNKRSQPAAKEEDTTPGPRFGVQTAFEPVFPTKPSTSIVPAEPQSEEIQDEFLEKRLGTGPLSQDWRRRTPEEPEEESPEDTYNREAGEYLSGARAASDKIQSPFSTNISRMSPINWGDDDQESTPTESRFSSVLGVPSATEPPVDHTDASYPYMTEDKKTLPSGLDKKTQPAPFIAYQPSHSLGQRLQSIPPLERILLAVLALAVIVVVAMIAIFYTQSRTPAVVAPTAVKTTLPTVTPSGVPIPVNLRLTGGWNFPLQRSTMVKGKWVPAGSEWLEGTEIRRVVGIPWSKQSEAVIQSMAMNDRIELVMNNGDILNYKVSSVGQVPASDTSILYDTKPSLVIVLINPEDVNRWVVIAYP